MEARSSIPMFSVVIPVHNGENFVAETVQSVLNQTYPHFRLFILENASQDRTLEIVSSFNDSRIIIVPTTEFLSIEDNWARILELDLAEYLTTLCHDDVLHPEFLEEIVNLIQLHPAATLYHTRVNVIDAQGGIVHNELFPTPELEKGDEFLLHFHQGMTVVIGSGFVMRSKDFKQVGGLPNFHKLHYADVYCYYRLTELGYKVCSPRRLCTFRLHQASEGAKAETVDIYIATLQYLNALDKTGLFTDLPEGPRRKTLISAWLASILRQRFRFFLKAYINSPPEALPSFRAQRARLSEEMRKQPQFHFLTPALRATDFFIAMNFRSLNPFLLRHIEQIPRLKALFTR